MHVFFTRQNKNCENAFFWNAETYWKQNETKRVCPTTDMLQVQYFTSAIVNIRLVFYHPNHMHSAKATTSIKATNVLWGICSYQKDSISNFNSKIWTISSDDNHLSGCNRSTNKEYHAFFTMCWWTVFNLFNL
jgi:hypothetical protein